MDDVAPTELPVPHPNEDDLAPADGFYGRHTTVPRQVLVPDNAPTTQTAAAKAKEAEAEAERFPNRTDPFVAYTPTVTPAPLPSGRDGGAAFAEYDRRYQQTQRPADEWSFVEEPPPDYADPRGHESAHHGANLPAIPNPRYQNVSPGDVTSVSPSPKGIPMSIYMRGRLTYVDQIETIGCTR